MYFKTMALHKFQWYNICNKVIIVQHNKYKPLNIPTF